MQRGHSLRKGLAIFLTSCLGNVSGVFALDNSGSSQVIYPHGAQPTFVGPDEWFSGEVKVTILFPSNHDAKYSGAKVVFANGARTAWHQHPAGQHMIVTSGVAITATLDGQVSLVNSGESLWCPANLEHWHGALPDSSMTHLVITGELGGKNVEWKEKVSDEQYSSAVSKARALTRSRNSD
ncbi:(R)-mandelonitrile lyase [Pleionea litopenaei]|uniref:Cupin domain-containing protein n=1 Tax=Pleionea litopenaei TaxID=3070815 RepID=A0AA51RV72_9GAMM|nr:cupin domain-containing protein [Pleionea sp. HL-JVS1]WMS88078.1 cupin domain-containing protein [Pleionea sp. HL-JVS1]